MIIQRMSILFVIVFVLFSCANESPLDIKSYKNTTEYNSGLKQGYWTYLNNLNKPCLEGEFDGERKVGHWKGYNCDGGISMAIDFYDDKVYYVTYYYYGTKQKLYRYGVKDDSVMNVMCVDYYNELTIDCKEFADEKHDLNLDEHCNCNE